MIKKLLAILFLLIMVIGFVVPGVLAVDALDYENYAVDEDFGLDVLDISEGVLQDYAVEAEAGDYTAALVATVSHGLLRLNSDGTFSYEPNENYAGEDSFTYNVIDADGLASLTPGTITITVYPVNDDVVLTAPADVVIEKKSTAYTLSYNLNDYARDVETVDASLIFSASNTNQEVVVCSLSGHTLNCVVQPNKVGTSFVTIHVDDGVVGGSQTSDETEFIIDVRDNVPEVPNAVNDAVETNKNVAKKITVLANDNDPDAGETISLTAITVAPTHGTVTQNVDGTITYTPATDYVGTDSFTYEITDNSAGALKDTATVTVTVVDPAANISVLEKTYNDLSTDLDTYDDEYYDLKDDYERAEDRENTDDLEDAEDSLNDLTDDLDKLLKDANDLLDDIQDADDTKYDTLEDNTEDLIDDIESVLARIERLLNPTTESLDFYSDDVPAQTTTPATTTGRVTINSLPPEILANVGPIDSPGETTDNSITNSLILLSVGIIVILAVIIFMVVVLLRR